MKGFHVLARVINLNTQRYVRFSHIPATRLYLDEFGEPHKVVKKEDFDLDTSNLKDNEVVVKVHLSPINPADINTIQGVYGVKPELPFTLGNEGFGEIIKTGGAVKKLRSGDWVIPDKNAWGTWRSHAIDDESSFRRIDNRLSPEMAATIAVNPCTAYRMIKDFENMKSGDSIIQNAANSAVGQNVIQIAKHLNLITVNIVRNREGIEQVKEELKNIGADHVLTEEEMRNSKIFDNKVPKPKLALNCVSGKSVISLIKSMADNGTLVTYGGMSRQPLVVPTAAFIFKNVKLVGYWMTRWHWEHHDDERDEMLRVLCEMAVSGSLQPPKNELVSVDEFREALKRASDPSGHLAAKLIFKF